MLEADLLLVLFARPCEILDARNNRQKVTAIFVDLSIAIDSVDDHLLIEK